MSFAWGWCFLALPLPWLVRRLLPAYVATPALRVPALPGGFLDDPGRPGHGFGWGPPWLAVLAWLLLVTAAARPQLPGAADPHGSSGRALMLAVDVSASMATSDLLLAGRRVDRLGAARHLTDVFLARLRGDRAGLVVFGAQAHLHTPLTADLEALRFALAGVEPGMVGKETALGDAIALATRHLQILPAEARILVLLTDGANTAGTLPPERAAWLAARAGVRIHAVGIGAADRQGADPGGAGRARAGVADATLQGVAETTGGSYSRATDAAELAGFFEGLEQLEATAEGGRVPGRDLYPWPLGTALALLGWLGWRRWREGLA